MKAALGAGPRGGPQDGNRQDHEPGNQQSYTYHTSPNNRRAAGPLVLIADYAG
jgi:hypothetical protein